MSVFIVLHTNIQGQELDKRLKDIRARYTDTLDLAVSFSDTFESNENDMYVLKSAGVDFNSVSNCVISKRKGQHQFLLEDAVELLKKELSDVGVIAMLLNETLI